MALGKWLFISIPVSNLTESVFAWDTETDSVLMNFNMPFLTQGVTPLVCADLTKCFLLQANSVAVFDAVSLAVTPYALGVTAQPLCVSESGDTAYFRAGNNVSSIGIPSGIVTAGTALTNGGFAGPSNSGVLANDTRLVSYPFNFTVPGTPDSVLIDLTTRLITRGAFPSVVLPANSAAPWRVLSARDGSTTYTYFSSRVQASTNQNDIIVKQNGITGAVVASFVSSARTTNQYRALQINGDGTRLYVTNQAAIEGANQIRVIDTATMTSVDTIPLAFIPFEIAINVARTHLYAIPTGVTNVIYKINISTKAVQSFPLGRTINASAKMAVLSPTFVESGPPDPIPGETPGEVWSLNPASPLPASPAPPDPPEPSPWDEICSGSLPDWIIDIPGE